MIEYRKGDLFTHLHEYSDKTVFIPQVNNNIHVWGSGFVIPVMRRWPDAEPRHVLSKSPLGTVEWDPVEKDIWLLNMIAQEGVGFKNGIRPLRYEHLVKCMVNVRDNILKSTILEKPAHIVTCQFGAKRAGGDWNFIEDLINEIWKDIPVTVFVYEE